MLKSSKFFLSLLVSALVLSVFSSCGIVPQKRTRGDEPSEATTKQNSLTQVYNSPTLTTATTTTESTKEKGIPVNISGLRKISADDTFDVKVTDVKVIRDYFNEYSYEGNDVLSFTVVNNNQNKFTITEIEIYACGYDRDDCYVELRNSAVQSLRQTSCVKLSWEDLSIAPGESQDIIFRFKNGDEISGAEAIVHSYKSSVIKYSNPVAEEWASSTLSY